MEFRRHQKQGRDEIREKEDCHENVARDWKTYQHFHSGVNPA